MNHELIDEAIYQLTLLLIKQETEDRNKGKTTYVKKTRAYKDLIKLLKELDDEKYKQIDEE
jgi:hypothetical protein